MNDPVSRELEGRARVRQPWVTALAAAVTLHAAVAVALVVLPENQDRALTLPPVQVRLVTPELPVAEPAPGPEQPAQPQPAPVPQSQPAEQPELRRPRPEPPAQRRPRPTPAPAVEPPQPRPRPTAEPALPAAQPEPEVPVSAPGGVGLGSDSRGATEEHFPFAYYLNRVLVAIEGNWFRPAAPSETRCRIRCRIDQSGRILEAGIENPSGIPAFDRAALRAVYAAAPFPPLPQGYGGSTLTLYLEFGQ